MRAALLDGGRLRLSELSDPKKQLAAINFLKLQGKWRTFPMKWKIGIWFGSLTRERLIEIDKQARKKAEEKWQEGLLEAARNYESRHAPIDVYVKQKLKL